MATALIIMCGILILFGVTNARTDESWFHCYKYQNGSELYKTTYKTCENYKKVTIKNCENTTTLNKIFLQIATKNSNYDTIELHVNDSSIIQLINFRNLKNLDLSNTKLQSINLSKYENLKYLNLSGNLLNTLQNIVLSDNVILKELDLSRNRFLELKNEFIHPTEVLRLCSNNIFELDANMTLPESLIRLDLTRNELGNLSEVIFLSKNLRALNLSVNLIEDVSEFTFANLPNLEELILSCNKIFAIDERTFLNNTKLIKLSLRDNNLTELREKTFHSLVELQFLDLSKNNLAKITPSTFQFLDSLSELILSENKHFCMISGTQVQFLLAAQSLQNVRMDKLSLTIFPTTLTRSVRLLDLSANDYISIQWGDLDSYPLLQTLKLQSNKIETVEYDVLGRLEYLEILLMDKNKLKQVPRTLPTNLKEIQLSENNIREISVDDFYELSEVRVLLLYSNQISYIKDGAFDHLRKLQILDISNNPLKVLNLNTLKGPSKLEILSLSGLRNLYFENVTFPDIEMSNIRKLNLSNSVVLGSLFLQNTEILASMKQTTIIDLSNTSITSIPYSLKYFMPQLQRLILSKNAVNCSNIEWLIKWTNEMKHEKLAKQSNTTNDSIDKVKYLKLIVVLNSQQNRSLDLKLPDNEDLTCIFPESLAGRPIFEIINTTSDTGGYRKKSQPDIRYDNYNNIGDNDVSDNIILCGRNTLNSREEENTISEYEKSEKTLDQIWYNIFGNHPDKDFLKPLDVPEVSKLQPNNITFVSEINDESISGKYNSFLNSLTYESNETKVDSSKEKNLETKFSFYRKNSSSIIPTLSAISRTNSSNENLIPTPKLYASEDKNNGKIPGKINGKIRSNSTWISRNNKTSSYTKSYSSKYKNNQDSSFPVLKYKSDVNSTIIKTNRSLENEKINTNSVKNESFVKLQIDKHQIGNSLDLQSKTMTEKNNINRLEYLIFIEPADKNVLSKQNQTNYTSKQSEFTINGIITNKIKKYNKQKHNKSSEDNLLKNISMTEILNDNEKEHLNRAIKAKDYPLISKISSIENNTFIDSLNMKNDNKIAPTDSDMTLSENVTIMMPDHSMISLKNNKSSLNVTTKNTDFINKCFNDTKPRVKRKHTIVSSSTNETIIRKLENKFVTKLTTIKHFTENITTNVPTVEHKITDQYQTTENFNSGTALTISSTIKNPNRQFMKFENRKSYREKNVLTSRKSNWGNDTNFPDQKSNFTQTLSTLNQSFDNNNSQFENDDTYKKKWKSNSVIPSTENNQILKLNIYNKDETISMITTNKAYKTDTTSDLKVNLHYTTTFPELFGSGQEELGYSPATKFLTRQIEDFENSSIVPMKELSIMSRVEANSTQVTNDRQLNDSMINTESTIMKNQLMYESGLVTKYITKNRTDLNSTFSYSEETGDWIFQITSPNKSVFSSHTIESDSTEETLQYTHHLGTVIIVILLILVIMYTMPFGRKELVYLIRKRKARMYKRKRRHEQCEEIEIGTVSTETPIEIW